MLLFCKGLRNKGLTRIPLGLHGVATIFDFYLDSINEKLSKHEYLGFGREQAGTRARGRASLKSKLSRAQKAFEATLSPSDFRRYSADVLTYLAYPRSEKDRFDPSIAQRWILQRAFQLGWSVEKFGDFDRDVNANMWSRDARKSERIGKKYQWIAYHEFLGLVADNFDFGNELYSDHEKEYDGPWQIYLRDIDPSCTLREIPGGDKSQESWWSSPAAYDWGSANQNSSWITSSQDLPSPESLIEVSDPKDGSAWLVLQSYPEWKEPTPAFEEEFEKPTKRISYQIRSFLVERKSAASTYSWLSKQNFWGRWVPEDPDHHGVFLGEFYWAPALKRHVQFADPKRQGADAGLGGVASSLIFTSGDYRSEMNSFDCSVEKGFSVFLPGAWLVNRMSLRWKGSEGMFFDSTDKLVAFDPALSSAGPHALLIRKETFLGLLKNEGYEVIWFLLGAKDVLGRGWARDDWPGSFS